MIEAETMKLPFTCATLLLAPVFALAAADVRYEQGKAWNPDKTRLLYTESHWTSYENDALKERTVLYSCADGTPFARKEISYANSTLAPGFSFNDVRFDYQEGLRWRGGQAQLWHKRANRARQEAVAESPNLVADAGFDVFVRTRWQALAKNGSQPLDFAVPSRLTSYSFNLARTDGALYRAQPAQNFKLGLNGWLGLVAPDIELTYGKTSKRLLRFKGISNILDNQGRKPVDALIEFPLADRAATAKEKLQAQATLLKSCQLS
jgi:hypothetical protein